MKGNKYARRKGEAFPHCAAAKPHWLLVYSARSASMGSNRAARHAGHRPLTIPTNDDTPTPSTAEPTLINNGKPINAAIR